MYATAQRVRASDGAEGVNGYLYRHGPGFPWPADPTPLADEDPGTLEAREEAVPPGGNRVRSYLDVLASDATEMAEIRGVFETFRQNLQEFPNPAVFRMGGVTLRYGVEIALEDRWNEALEELETAVGRLLDRP